MFPSRIFDKCVYILFFLNCISFSCTNPHRCWCLRYCHRIARICASYPQVFAFSLRVNNVTFWGNLTIPSIFFFPGNQHNHIEDDFLSFCDFRKRNSAPPPPSCHPCIYANVIRSTFGEDKLKDSIENLSRNCLKLSRVRYVPLTRLCF